MALRREFTLGQSEFNPFLYALVGEDGSGSEVTVLSALARMDLDPWEEARRLLAMPPEAATRALSAVIAALPEGHWRAADIPRLAGLLLERLPHRAAQAGGEASGSRLAAFGAPNWILWLVLGLALVFALIRM